MAGAMEKLSGVGAAALLRVDAKGRVGEPKGGGQGEEVVGGEGDCGELGCQLNGTREGGRGEGARRETMRPLERRKRVQPEDPEFGFGGEVEGEGRTGDEGRCGGKGVALVGGLRIMAQRPNCREGWRGFGKPRASAGVRAKLRELMVELSGLMEGKDVF